MRDEFKERASVSEVSFDFYEANPPFRQIVQKRLITSKWPFPKTPYCPRAMMMNNLKSYGDESNFIIVVTVDEINLIIIEFELIANTWQEKKLAVPPIFKEPDNRSFNTNFYGRRFNRSTPVSDLR